MLYRCYMVLVPKGNEVIRAIFLDQHRATDYAAKNGGHVIHMVGKDSNEIRSDETSSNS